MSLSITLTMNGRDFECREDAPGCSSVVVDGASCPVCADKVALVDRGPFESNDFSSPLARLKGGVPVYGRGKIVAIVNPMKVAAVQPEVEKKHGPCTIERPSPGDLFRIIGPKPREIDDRELHSPAECARCRSEVGTIVVRFATIFGFTEDRAVLHGRARVY